MDASFYASQFDTARELLANNNSEAPTGLYAILCALHDLYKLNDEVWKKHKIHSAYKNTVIAVFLVYHTVRKTDVYNNKVFTRYDSFLLIQNFKHECFKEITLILEKIKPKDGIEWRIIK